MAFQSRRTHPRRRSLLRWTIFLSFVAVFVVFLLNSQVNMWSKPLKPHFLVPQDIRTTPSTNVGEVTTASEEVQKSEAELVNSIREEAHKEATTTNIEEEESGDETESPEEHEVSPEEGVVEEETTKSAAKIEEVGPHRAVIEPMSEAVAPESEASDSKHNAAESDESKSEKNTAKSEELGSEAKASSPSSGANELQSEAHAPRSEDPISDEGKLVPLDEATAVSSTEDDSETYAVAPQSYTTLDEASLQEPSIDASPPEANEPEIEITALDSDAYQAEREEVQSGKTAHTSDLEERTTSNPVIPRESVAPVVERESVAPSEVKEAVAPAEIHEAVAPSEVQETVASEEVKETVSSAEVKTMSNVPQAKKNSTQITENPSKSSVDGKTILSKQESHPNPKIALLFLTRGALPHEPSWRAFFEAAGRLLLRHPAPNMDHLDSISGTLLKKFKKINNSKQRRLFQLENRLNSTACKAAEKLMKKEVKRLMTKAENPSSVISGQTLFTVYVHPRPKYTLPESSIFSGKEIKERADTTSAWGSFRLVKAELFLLTEALKDLTNKKFVLLSESCIPIYPPEVIYAQLMSEKKSRMASCKNQSGNQLSRYTNKMKGKYFDWSNWRKSSQWFALNRAHVGVLLNETYIKKRFKQHCNGQHGKRYCVPDEHYIPSTLNAFGLSNQTDCSGAITFKKFTGGAHPVAFYAQSIQPSLFLAFRHKKECIAGTARTTATALFDGIPRHGTCLRRNYSSIHSVDKTDQSEDWVINRGYVPMNSSCPLFARKFASSTVEKTLETCLSCTGGSLGYWC